MNNFGGVGFLYQMESGKVFISAKPRHLDTPTIELTIKTHEFLCVHCEFLCVQLLN